MATNIIKLAEQIQNKYASKSIGQLEDEINQIANLKNDEMDDETYEKTHSALMNEVKNFADKEIEGLKKIMIGPSDYMSRIGNYGDIFNQLYRITYIEQYRLISKSCRELCKEERHFLDEIREVLGLRY